MSKILKNHFFECFGILSITLFEHVEILNSTAVNN